MDFHLISERRKAQAVIILQARRGATAQKLKGTTLQPVFNYDPYS
jgi:hypothetical protein